MKTTFTKEELEKAYKDGVDKRTWFEEAIISGGGPEYDWTIKEPNFDKWFDKHYPSTREGMLAKLEKQYKEQFAGQGYPDEFKAHAYMTQCNFGGMFIILHNSGDGVIVWSDWADTAISDELVECELEYHDDTDFDGDTDEDDNMLAQFKFQDTWYNLNDFMKI